MDRGLLGGQVVDAEDVDSVEDGGWGEPLREVGAGVGIGATGITTTGTGTGTGGPGPPFGAPSDVPHQRLGHIPASLTTKAPLRIHIHRLPAHPTVGRGQPGIDTQLHCQLRLSGPRRTGQLGQFGEGDSAAEEGIDRPAEGDDVPDVLAGGTASAAGCIGVGAGGGAGVGQEGRRRDPAGRPGPGPDLTGGRSSIDATATRTARRGGRLLDLPPQPSGLGKSDGALGGEVSEARARRRTDIVRRPEPRPEEDPEGGRAEGQRLQRHARLRHLGIGFMRGFLAKEKRMLASDKHVFANKRGKGEKRRGNHARVSGKLARHPAKIVQLVVR